MSTHAVVEELSSARHEGGAGTPLVLLHGLGGTWHIWKPVLRLLEERHRVIAVTLPGHWGGRALPNGVEPSIGALADALLADLRERGLAQAHVAGNSLGGWLSLELLRRGFALSVTALSPAGGWRTRKDYLAVARPFRIVFALIPVLLFLTSLFLRFAGVRRFLNKQAMEHGDRLSEGECRHAMRAMRQTHILPGLLRSMERDGAIRPLDASSTVVRVAWSQHDKVIPFATYGEPILAAVTGAQALTVAGVGHVPIYDDPEQVATIILATTSSAEAAAVPA